MKKVISLFALSLFGFAAHAQMFSYGPVAGVGASTYAYDGGSASPQLSYQVGGFARFKLAFLYVQPEILFQSLSSHEDDLDIQLTHNRFDVPVNVGWKILMFDLNTGPMLSIPVSAKLDDIDIADQYVGSYLSWQFGAGVELGPIHVGARYSYGFQDVIEDSDKTRWHNLFAHVEYQF